MFLDIRPWIESNALQLLISNFDDPRVGCVAGELVLNEDGHDAGAKAIGSFVLAIRAVDSQLRSKS